MGSVIVHLTGVGALLLVLAGLFLLLRPAWLVPLLIVCAVMQAPAAVIISIGEQPSVFGLSPWLLVTVAIMVHLTWLLITTRRSDLGNDKTQRLLLIGWSAYVVLAVLSAFILPWAFDGALVYWLGNRSSVQAGLVPLHLSITNFVQAVNLTLNGLLLLYLARVARLDGYCRRVAAGFAASVVVSVLLLLYQRGMYGYGFPALTWFVDSLNPSYVQTAYFGGLSVRRLSWPFTEPSYASVWFGGIYVAGLAVLLLTKRVLVGGACMLAGTVGLFTAYGMSGLSSAIIMTLFTGGVALRKHIILAQGPGFRWRSLPWKRFMVGGCLFVATAWISLEVSGLHSPLEIWEKLVLPRLYGKGISGTERSLSNWQAVGLVRDTWGMGVGLGSHRASSYLLSLLSNIGVVLTVGFLALIGYQAWLVFSRWKSSTLGIFLLYGGVAVFLGATLGIPDLNWPGWWIWVLCTFALGSMPPPHERFLQDDPCNHGGQVGATNNALARAQAIARRHPGPRECGLSDALLNERHTAVARDE
jgi:hypothetical protein